MDKETIARKAKKALKGLFGGGEVSSAAAKPTPKDLGKGYAAGAAKKLTDHNKQTEATLKELDSYKKGGKVKKNGPANLHKGERVLTTKQTQKLDKKPAVKKAIGLKAKKK